MDAWFKVSHHRRRRRRRVVLLVMDVAVPTSVLQACRFCA